MQQQTEFASGVDDKAPSTRIVEGIYATKEVILPLADGGAIRWPARYVAGQVMQIIDLPEGFTISYLPDYSSDDDTINIYGRFVGFDNLRARWHKGHLVKIECYRLIESSLVKE